MLGGRRAARAVSAGGLAAVLAASGAGCRPRLATRRGSAVAGAVTLPPRPSSPDPPPPDQDPKPPPPPAGGRGGALGKKDPLRSRKDPPSREADEEPPSQEQDLSWRLPRSTEAASTQPGDRPDDGALGGTPLARRPEDGSVGSPGPPLHYLSPAPLKPLRTARRAPDAEGAAPEDEDDPAQGRGRARRPSRAPATGLMLDDDIPEAGVADPNAIGSYHVQIASSPEFSRVLFDKIYPFMGEAELFRDLEGAPPSLDHVWIRWSLVDLLDYEHPFARPRRLKLAHRGGDRL